MQTRISRWRVGCMKGSWQYHIYHNQCRMKCHKTNALTPSAKGLEAERQNRPLEKIRKDLTEEVVSVMKVKLWTIYQFTQTGRTAWWGWRGRGEWQDRGDSKEAWCCTESPAAGPAPFISLNVHYICSWDAHLTLVIANLILAVFNVKWHWYYYGKFLSFHSSNKHYLEAMDQILHLYNIPREIIHTFWVYFNYIFFNFYWNSKQILLSLFWKWSVLSMLKIF